MKITINKESCIGCGACFTAYEDLFEMTDDGLSKVKVDVIPDDRKEAALEAMASCPTSAIEEVKEEQQNH